MKIRITVNGEVTYTHEREDTSVGGNVTASQDTHSLVLEDVTLRLETEEPERPAPLAAVFATLLEEAFTSAKPREDAPDEDVPVPFTVSDLP